MGTKRQLAAAAAVLAVSGCTWGQSAPGECDRFAVSAGNARLEALAAAAGASRVTVVHALCSGKLERLNGLAGIGGTEVGWCARVEEPIPATASAASASVRKWCAAAVERQVRYAHWSSVIGDQYLFVAERDVIESPLRPPASDPSRKR